MHPTTQFDAYVSEARVIVAWLSSHDPDYERGLASGAVTGALRGTVLFATSALELAYGELGHELALRCKLPVGTVRYRLPIFPAPSTRQPDGSGDLMDSLRHREAALAARVRSQLEVATADGWLGALMHLAGSPAEMNLRRAVATVAIAKGADGIFEMNLRSETGMPIPLLAPVLLQENPASFEHIKKGYYLAVLPEAREVVSFLDRCVRGMSSLGDRLREELVSFGY